MKIDREQWSRLSALLDAALEIDPSDRDAWLQRLPDDAAMLKASLQTLLAQRAHIETGDFLKTPDFASALRSETARSQTQPIELEAGSTVGAYRLLRELGRGGMAAVWLAERVDGKFKRQVALKFPYAGPNQRQLAERLTRERDILASLEHPNIARLYDADVMALGQPFLVLEYVDGIPINEYCDQQSLTLRQRLVLFLQVLNAVQYAHTHLVIHRDLKPSNIMLTKDAKAQLLDFGVAKLIAKGEVQESALTQFGGRALTPEYASPEQINGEPITTACDVYALGVVLYELLTGNRPYRLKRGAGSLEAAIVAADVVAPSRTPVDLETAQKRSLSTRQLERMLRGDLDTIVLKALRREPLQRYASADALAQDIGRYLDGEPVAAQAESFTYRAAKFVGRHRFGVAATAAIVVAILVGTMAALWQARQADKERDRALVMLGRNEAVTDFMTVMITEAAASNEALTMPMLIERSEAMLAGNARDAQQLAVIKEMLAGYYLSFSQPARAEKLLAAALEQTRDDPDPVVRASLTCKHAYAKSLLDNSYPARQEITAAIASIPNEPETIALCLRDSAYIAQNANDAKGALDAALQAQQAYRLTRRSNPVLEASILVDLGYAYQLNGRSDLADQNFAAALQQFTALGRGENAEIVTLLNNWGLADISAGDIQGAVARLDEAFVLAKRHSANGDPPAYLVFNRAVAQERLGHLDEALNGYDQAIALGTATRHAGTIAVGQAGRARILLARNDLRGAHGAYEALISLTKKEAVGEGPAVLGALFLKASIALKEGRVNDALDGFTEELNYLDSRKMAIGATVVALRERSAVYLQLGNPEAALTDAKRALTIATALQSGKPYSCMTGFAQLAMSRVFLAKHDIDSSHQWAQQAADQLSHSLSEDHPDTVAARKLAANSVDATART